MATSVISFGVGMAVGVVINNSWGWNSWGCGWHGGTVNYNRNVYVSNSNVYRNGGYYGNRPRPTPYGGGNLNRSGNRNTKDASKALYDAGKSGDKTAIEAVLGSSSASIISSGDAASAAIMSTSTLGGRDSG